MPPVIPGPALLRSRSGLQDQSLSLLAIPVSTVMYVHWYIVRVQWTVPDLRNGFTKGGGDLVGKVLKDGQIREKECAYGHFSPSCTEESKLRFMEKANGRDKGERSADQKKSIEEVVAGIKAHSARVPGWAWTIEQPDGSRISKYRQDRPPRALWEARFRPQTQAVWEPARNATCFPLPWRPG